MRLQHSFSLFDATLFEIFGSKSAKKSQAVRNSSKPRAKRLATQDSTAKSLVAFSQSLFSRKNKLLPQTCQSLTLNLWTSSTRFWSVPSRSSLLLISQPHGKCRQKNLHSSCKILRCHHQNLTVSHSQSLPLPILIQVRSL